MGPARQPCRVRSSTAAPITDAEADKLRGLSRRDKAWEQGGDATGPRVALAGDDRLDRHPGNPQGARRENDRPRGLQVPAERHAHRAGRLRATAGSTPTTGPTRLTGSWTTATPRCGSTTWTRSTCPFDRAAVGPGHGRRRRSPTARPAKTYTEPARTSEIHVRLKDGADILKAKMQVQQVVSDVVRRERRGARTARGDRRRATSGEVRVETWRRERGQVHRRHRAREGAGGRAVSASSASWPSS